MRTILVILSATVCCVACSKADVSRTSSDLKTAASHVKNDPAVKKLGTDIKVAAKDTGDTLKKAGADAKVGLKKAGADLKETAQKTKQDVKEKASS